MSKIIHLIRGNHEIQINILCPFSKLAIQISEKGTKYSIKMPNK